MGNSSRNTSLSLVGIIAGLLLVLGRIIFRSPDWFLITFYYITVLIYAIYSLSVSPLIFIKHKKQRQLALSHLAILILVIIVLFVIDPYKIFTFSIYRFIVPEEVPDVMYDAVGLCMNQ